MEKQIAHWLATAQEDVAAARSIFAGGHLRHAAFFVELGFEKVLKALVAQATQDFPPKIHNLLRLAELAGIQLDEAKKKRYKQVQEYCLEGRYPGYIPDKLEREEVEALFTYCEEESAWLRQILEQRLQSSRTS